MPSSAEPRCLLLETSTHVGLVAVAAGGKVLASRNLEETRRHARDLAPAVRDLLAGQGWRPIVVGILGEIFIALVTLGLVYWTFIRGDIR